MKVIIAVIVSLIGFKASACVVDFQAVNEKVSREVVENLELTLEDLKSQKLVHFVEFYPQPRISSCPNSVVFYHAFKAGLEGKFCSIMTKYKLSFVREEINTFTVLELECE